jgi:2-polyprenyl-3-methyl-5-hydroxy-6-metoxy-1,4-benzoquinol methylase
MQTPEGRVTIDLVDHLARYEIRHFADDSYWEWGATILDRKTGRKIERYMGAHAEGRATPSQSRHFYDLIATPQIASVVHSLKADAIRSSGQAVADTIGSARRVLDLGCGLGYLTTYYAAMVPTRHILGCDASQKTIHYADVFAKKFEVRNVEFAQWQADEEVPPGPWDAVTSTQLFSELDGHETLLKDIASQLADDGMVVSVDAFGRHQDVERLFAVAAKCGLHVTQFGWCRYSDLGVAGAYPMVVLTTSATPTLNIDLQREWEAMLAELEA